MDNPSGVLSFKEFNREYFDVLNGIWEYWTPEMQKEIAVHNTGWNPEKFDFREYLESSSIRFYRAYLTLYKNEGVKKICDIGGFWGLFPLTLSSLGYDVSMTESLGYYAKTFDPLFEYIRSKGVKIIDWDPFQDDADSFGSFDFVTIMALLEHYPHSLRTFIKNVKSITEARGSLYIDVPNIAYWQKRVKLLLGRTPLTDVEVIYESEVPFIGHHHEYTLTELQQLANLSGLTLVSHQYFNCPKVGRSWAYKVSSIVDFIALNIFPSACECIALECHFKK